MIIKIYFDFVTQILCGFDALKVVHACRMIARCTFLLLNLFCICTLLIEAGVNLVNTSTISQLQYKIMTHFNGDLHVIEVQQLDSTMAEFVRINPK